MDHFPVYAKIPDFAVQTITSPSSALERFFVLRGVQFRTAFLDFITNIYTLQVTLRMTSLPFMEFVATDTSYHPAAFNFLLNTFVSAVGENKEIGTMLLDLALNGDFDEFAEFADQYADRPIITLLTGYYAGKYVKYHLREAA